MMKEDNRDRLLSLLIAIVLHVMVVILLVYVTFDLPSQDEESGILLLAVEGASPNPVQGAHGVQEVQDVQEVQEVQNVPADIPQNDPPSQSVEEPVITQDDEAAPSMPSAEEKAQREAEAKRQAQLAAEAQARAEAEALAKAEAERKAREEAERKRREAERIASQVGGLFGQGSGGAAGESSEGSVQGNSPVGATHGSPGWGTTVDLGGRGLNGDLPRPAFDVNASGIVVVRISVNALGNVISAYVQPKGTTTTDVSLRNAAVSAAKKTKFVKKDGSPTMTGTITYRFDSNN